jgi:hypothetical protein
MLLLDFWPLNRISKRAVIEKIPLLAVGCIFALITIVSQAQTARVEMPGEYSIWRIPLIVCHDIVFYPCKMVWPTNLTSHYPVPQPLALSNPTVLAGAIGACTLVSVLVASLRWTRALMTGWLIFMLAIFPTMGVIGFTIVLTSDKYAYLPAVGFLIVLAWLFDHLADKQTRGRLTWRPAALGAGVLAAAGLLTIGTRHYLKEWQTSERHCFYMLRLAPNSANVLNHCGNVLDTDKQYERAIECYSRAIILAPRLEYAYNNRGNTYNTLRQYDLALQDYDKAIALKPDYAAAYYNRANTLSDVGRYDEAVRDYSRAIELKRGYADAYHNRAIAFFYLQKYDQAWADVGMFRRLGGTPTAGLISALTAATGRSE